MRIWGLGNKRSEQEKKRQTIEKIQERLKDHKGRLEVYANNRGVFIKGTQLPAGVLAQFAKIYGKEGVLLTAEPDTPYKKVAGILEDITEGGIENVTFTTPPKTGN